MESFGPGRDTGIDFRFSHAGGAAIVQAKHYIDSPADAVVRAARAEAPKIARLKPTRYIFATSASLTPPLKARIKEAIPETPLSLEDIFGRADLNNLLGRHQKLEQKHFKLWLASAAVLERILHSGVYNRTQAEMEVIKTVVPKFVSNESVSRAEEILKKHNVLIIAGEPGVGKSTLARMLVWRPNQRLAFDISAGENSSWYLGSSTKCSTVNSGRPISTTNLVKPSDGVGLARSAFAVASPPRSPSIARK
jgi:hypothetical protein